MVVMLSTGTFTEESSKLVLKYIFVLFSVDFETLSLNRFHNSSSLFNNIGNFVLRHLWQQMYMQCNVQHWNTPLMMPSILVKSEERKVALRQTSHEDAALLQQYCNT